MNRSIVALRKRLLRLGWGCSLPVALLLTAPAAHAVDGCKVLLCLAGNWKSISACRPEVTQALRDIARGRAWPTCSMQSGPTNSAVNSAAGTPARNAVTTAEHQWARFPDNCPAQYVQGEFADAWVYSCRYSGVVDVWISGRLWSRVWWNMGGETSTQYSSEARAQLGERIDPKFDLDHATWQAEQEAAAAAAAAAAQSAAGG